MGLFHTTFTHIHTTTLKPLQPTVSELSATPRPTSEACYEAAVALLHDPSVIITLNPVVTDFEEVDSSSPSVKPLLPPLLDSALDAQPPSRSINLHRKFFRITDSKPLLGGWYNATISYHISYLRVDGGCDTVVAAPAGVSIDGSWRVSKDGASGQDEDEELILEERATVICPRIFAPFIRGTLGSTHGEMHDRFVKKWKARLSTQERKGHTR
ncbi:hypothetical protein GJ744_011417 [Endocarpon pusillum]|uniref:DUF7053 domain-containing protein n=1 Tax=Endocarpon pusillum TaxID=364733 RepID=A0A8H7ACX5_9EURO|nr:hypothetical protein GJ744_011417 [Endocarpon pusillum]